MSIKSKIILVSVLVLVLITLIVIPRPTQAVTVRNGNLFVAPDQIVECHCPAVSTYTCRCVEWN